jgi:hypothetical protein
MALSLMSSQDVSIMDSLLTVFYPFLLIFIFSGGALFSCLGWMTASMLTIVAERVIKQNSCNSCGDWEKKLVTWKKQYLKISRLVDKMNQCYGSLLLVLIASTFVVLIGSSFNIMRRVSDKGLSYSIFTHVLLWIIQFSHFAVLAYVPHRIRESVRLSYS